MTGNKRVRLAFRRFWETGNSTELPQIVKIVLSACQQLMDVGLMTDIENKPVFFRIIYFFNSDGQFDSAQIGSQMAACVGDLLNQKFPDLITQALQLFNLQSSQIVMPVDSF